MSEQAKAKCSCGRPVRHSGSCIGIGSKWVHTEETDQLIRDAYHKYRAFGNRTALGNVAEKLGWPKHVVNKRSRVLGISRTRERPWSAEEVGLLDRSSHYSLGRIAQIFRKAGFSRSETAIKLKAKRLLITKGTIAETWMTLRQVAEMLGEEGHKVSGWVRLGWLASVDTGKTCGKDLSHIRVVNRAELRRFLLNHPDEYDLAKVEKYLFLDVISRGKLLRQYVEAS